MKAIAVAALLLQAAGLTSGAPAHVIAAVHEVRSASCAAPQSPMAWPFGPIIGSESAIGGASRSHMLQCRTHTAQLHSGFGRASQGSSTGRPGPGLGPALQGGLYGCDHPVKGAHMSVRRCSATLGAGTAPASRRAPAGAVAPATAPTSPRRSLSPPRPRGARASSQRAGGGPAPL